MADTTTKKELKGKGASALSEKPLFARNKLWDRLGGKPSRGEDISRRQFFSWLGVAWLAFASALSAATIATVRFMFPNVLFEPPQIFKAGFPSDYGIGEVNEKFKDKFGAWIIRSEEGIYALSTVCTHLGCTPNWLSAEEKIKCPCHGSGFYKSGINFEGPAPRPLERFRIVLADDGQMLVDKTRIYQQEKGQWNDPESMLKV